MIKRSSIWFCLISITAFMISLPIWASAEGVGNFTQIEKHVDYQKGPTGKATPAKVNEPVNVNDIIQTYEVSRAQVLFRDKTTITIAPKSKVAVENYMFDPAKFERTGKFDLIEGVMKVVVPTAEKMEKSTITIKTSTTIMGIRGTEFMAISGTYYSVVYGIKGRVCLKPNPKEPGKYSIRRVAPGEPIDKDEVCLDANTMSVILNNQPPTRSQAISPEVMAAAVALLATGVNNDPKSCPLSTLPGVDLAAVAKDLIAQGADIDSVKESLAEVCFALTDTYTYCAPEAPITPASLPTFPGGGGGGSGETQVAPVTVASDSQ
jgi:FecR protein